MFIDMFDYLKAFLYIIMVNFLSIRNKKYCLLIVANNKDLNLLHLKHKYELLNKAIGCVSDILA